MTLKSLVPSILIRVAVLLLVRQHGDSTHQIVVPSILAPLTRVLSVAHAFYLPPLLLTEYFYPCARKLTVRPAGHGVDANEIKCALGSLGEGSGRL